MRKPRIRLWRGVWHCFQVADIREPFSKGYMGIGYTPALAYEDWWRHTRRTWVDGEAALVRLADLSRQMEEEL